MKPSLAVNFAGLKLNSPIVAASAPPTESVQAIRACADAGAGAVVTKSILDYDRKDWPNLPRRVKVERQKLWIQGSFSSETLTLAEGFALVAKARDQVDIPIIASVGVLNPRDDQAIETALALVEAGADMVHFDLFYLPQPRCSDAMSADLVSLFHRARQILSVPFGPKLNIDLPAHHIANIIPNTSIDCMFLLDSIRVPPPLNSYGQTAVEAWKGGLECSLFGEWQKPISLQYSRVLAEEEMPNLCVGGGLRNASDIWESFLLGATCVQAATQIMVHGYDWIRRTNDDLARKLSDHGFETLDDIKNRALQTCKTDAPETVEPMRAIIDPGTCKPCGVCTKLAFCPFIEGLTDSVPTISDACYGCGLCEAYCPQPGAIVMEPV